MPKTRTPPARERLMDAAERLMIERGFVATSVDDICAAAKVNRGSFFYYFESKEALAKQLIPRFTGKMKSAIESSCCAEADPRDRLYAWIECAIAMSKHAESQGCLVGALAQEISVSHPELRACCGEAFDGMIGGFEADLREAKKKYAPRSGADPASLAESFVATAQGAMLLAKAKKDRKVFDRALRNYKAYLQSILGG